MSSRTWVGMVAVAVLLLPLAACDADAGPDPEPTRTPDGPPAQLTFGAFGTEDEMAAFQAVTDTFNSLYDDAEVELVASRDAVALRESLESGDVPDVFMVSRQDLAWLLEKDLTQPVDALLDDRGVDFGDAYSRDGLQAFSAEDRLQCMPYGISPMVIFYNRDLVDFERMELRGLDVPDETPTDLRSRTQSWTFDEFAAAAEFAARPRQKTRGVYVEPTLEALAPFVHSGGGPLFDDETDPTSLAFSDGDTEAALERSLTLLRSPLVTPSASELQQSSALEMFKDGRLAMIEGYRRLVPELRQTQGLDFDVMAMPVLEQAGTVGEVTGLCLSADAASTPAAADFLVHLTSTPSVQRVALTGYLVPANLEVALSDDFLQPGRAPAHSGVFNTSVRSISFPPLAIDWPALEDAVADSLQQLLNQPVIDDLGMLTEQIDEESRTVLDPETVEPSESPEE